MANFGDIINTLAMSANQAVRMNAAGAAFEAFTPLPFISLTQNFSLQQIANTIASKAGTVTGTAGFGSSLFLQRLVIPAQMSVSEIDMALSIAFPATNQGAGTMSRSFVIYSMGNSTSLASVMSASGTSAWNTGTSTAGASSSLTQFQGGWSTPLIQPMTFASTTLKAGEYVIGQIFDFAQGSSTWTLNLYGANAFSNVIASAATNLTSATLGALSSGGLLAASAYTASASSALTAFTATPVVASAMLSNALLAASAHTASGSMSVLSTNGLLAGSVHTASTGSALTAWTAAASAMAFSGVASTAGFSTTNVSTFTAGSLVIKATATAASTLSLLLNTATGAFGALSSGGFLAGSFHTASGIASVMSSGGLLAGSFFTAATGSSAVLANSSTGAVALMGSAGLLAGSFLTASGSLGAVTNVALGALNSTTLARATLPNFGFIGTGSTTSGYPGAFIAGIMSTGGIPAAITLTSTAVTYSGSIAFQQPWFALLGA